MIKRESIWSVFPVQQNDKKPYPFLRNSENQRGFYVATSNEEQILFWEKMYKGCNWALRTGSASGCWVLDIDVKNGARGEESFFDILGTNKDFPNTLSVKTPTGGIHYYFEMEPGVRTLTNTGKFGGIDVRADGGYVLIPPSVINGSAYEYLNEGKILKAPEWLKKKLFPIKSPSKSDAPIERIEQSDYRADSMSKYLLSKYLPKAIKGMRNKTLMDMLCQMRDNIVPQHIAEERALEFVHAMCDPDFTRQEAMATVRSVYRRAGREPSYVDLNVEFNIKEVHTLGNYDQAGIAEYILYRHQNIVYIPEKSWAIFDESKGFWKTSNADSEVSDIVVEELRELAKMEDFKGSNALFKVTRRNVEDIMSFIKKRVVKPYEQFNARPELINCKNGVINLRTMELTKHNPCYYFDYVLDVNFDPNSSQTIWNKFLRESLENADKDEGGVHQLELLQLAAGYSMTGETCEECLFYIYGKTRSGKSTFINTINDILGPLASTIQMSSLMQKKIVTDTQNFELASLVNKRFVVSSETDRETYLDSARIKSLTGRDTIKCAYKFKDPFQAKVKFKIWLTSNNEITVDASDEAVWGRFRTFSFPYSKLDNVDINLKDKLMENRDGIFFWLCLGAHVWYGMKERGERLPVPASMKEYLDSRKAELDTFGEFLAYYGYYCTTKNKDDNDIIFVTIQDMYEKYSLWCDMNHIKNKYSKTSMASILSQRGYQKDTQRMGDRTYRGVWVRPLK